jgi:hypothetical protein
MKWRLPGPQVPAQAVRRPVISARLMPRTRGLLVPHVDPIDLAPVDGVGDPVQCVTDDPQHVVMPEPSSVSTTTSATRFDIAEPPIACSLGATRCRSRAIFPRELLSEPVLPCPLDGGQTV